MSEQKAEIPQSDEKEASEKPKAKKPTKVLPPTRAALLKEKARQMYWGLFSKDRRTRRFSWLFFICIFGIGWMVIFSPFATNEKLKKLEEQKAAELEEKADSIKPLEAAKRLNLLEEEEKEKKRSLDNTLYLGKFITELEGQEQISSSSGVLNIAEIHITIQCDSKLTCDYIEKRLGKIRDSITGLIRPLTRAKLLSPEGKEELKERIIKGLNHWLPPKRSVENLFFTKLIIG